jgi:peptidyl-prolyl cis-trans isomerase SurA
MLLAGLALTVAPAVAQTAGTFNTTQQPSPYSGTIVEQRIAQVNDEIVSKSDYDRADQEMQQEAQQQNWTQQQIFEQRRDLLRSLIDRQLLLSQAKLLGINGETEVVKRLDEIRKQNHMDSMEDLQKAVEAQGISFEDFKEQIRENVITQQVIGQEVGGHISISSSEVQEYYNAHKQEFQRPETVKLNEILVATPNPDDAAQVAEAEKKADGIEDKLKGGADFAATAKSDSSGPTAQDGGRLGEYKSGDLPKVMEDATFNLKTGQFTSPIRTKQGWLILEVADHQAGGIATLEQVQGQIQEQVGMQKMEPALRDYLTKLRDQAYIDIRPGYVDSGASPNELKFIQGAYVPPSPKKKKHIERTRYGGRPARGRKAPPTAAAAATPAGVPSLDKVNSQTSAPTQVASAAGTQKPGKKEKIRFGQAPRETLPTGATRDVDAGATVPAPQEQVAINQSGAAPNLGGDDTADSNADEKKAKTRFTDRARETKEKQAQLKAATKRQKFVPPPVSQTPEAQATDKRQDAALGLKGDTTKPVKNASPTKTGPKRRISDEEKKKEQEQTTPPASGTTPTTPPASAPSAPAPTSTPGSTAPAPTQR